jgi:hypothetical protein
MAARTGDRSWQEKDVILGLALRIPGSMRRGRRGEPLSCKERGRDEV